MAATELLDYNQVQEQSPSTGDSIPATGGPIIWQFRADPNLAWDPSQSFFAMDVTIRSKANDGTGQGAIGVADSYIAGPCDLRPFFPLRCFDGASHVIDGVTVAQTSHPYLDKVVQEKFLHETTLSNYSNFESLQLCRAIDDGIKEHNIFRGHADNLFDLYEQGWRSTIQLFNGPRQGLPMATANSAYPTHTVIFQPPFDFWTKHQRVSGGNHQVTLNLRAAKGEAGTGTGKGTRWGDYVATTCAGAAAAQAGASLTRVANTAGSDAALFVAAAKGMSTGVDKTTEVGGNLQMEIHRIRLMRRMVRFTIERPIATQEYNLTEMQLYVGQPDKSSMTQNFLLPSSTFGLVFFWRKSDNADYDVYNDYPRTGINHTDGAVGDNTEHFMLDQFYFTYGGETYPSQRITDISGKAIDDGSFAAASGTALGYEKLQMLTNQLMGTYNMPMEYLNTSYSGDGLMERLDSQMFFFPVAKHSNSDNSDLQVYWSGNIRKLAAGDDYAPGGFLDGAQAAPTNASLCVVALYDARIELSYNSANQLEKVTKTEWK